MTKKALELIESIPAWSDIPADDLASRNEVIERMKQLARYNLKTLRNAIQRYIAKRQRAEAGYDVAAMSRLYALNRYLFNVPDKLPVGSRRFGSFFGIPHDSEWINELWPLSFDANGELVLTGQFRGYFGEAYLALEEFDYFQEKYGPRNR